MHSRTTRRSVSTQHTAGFPGTQRVLSEILGISLKFPRFFSPQTWPQFGVTWGISKTTDACSPAPRDADVIAVA